MRIAIFEYKVISTNPAGSCVLKFLSELYRYHDFTVFSLEFENPQPNHIRFIKIRSPHRPLALLFICFHIIAFIYFSIERLKGEKYDLIQYNECNFLIGKISYVHFCHRAYLRKFWLQDKEKGFRGILRLIDHKLHAFIEPVAFNRVQRIIVPSSGLKEELEEEYPFTKNKISIIPNPIDLEYFAPNEKFDSRSFRNNYGIHSKNLVVIFIALGHYRRKGLHLLLDSICSMRNVHLFVVGGEKDLIKKWKRRSENMNLGRRVHFVGFQKDIRPFLWSSDIFTLPSHYEIFSLAIYQAAAAALPLILTPIYGIDELIEQGNCGYLVPRSSDGIRSALVWFSKMPKECREAMGIEARRKVSKYDSKAFVESWKLIFSEF